MGLQSPATYSQYLQMLFFTGWQLVLTLETLQMPLRTRTPAVAEVALGGKR
jgi:hypothetical protein